MKVVGHTVQLLQSPCYQKTKTLTCMTCHNPHDRAPANNRTARHRQSCLNCHNSDACHESNASRQQTSPPDNCLACHMPNVPTETLHVAVTHHRIGIHRDDTIEGSYENDTQDLEPIHDLSRFSQTDQSRSLGLAYLRRFFKLGINSGPESNRLRDKSLKLLLQSQQDGLGDPDVHATLAQLLFQNEPLRAVSHARIALEQPTLKIEPRLNALFALANHHHSRKQPKQALVHLDQLTRLRRSSFDWELRALCLLQQRDLTATINALETAIGIDPNLLLARNLLVQLYEGQRQFELANTQKQIIRRLDQFLQKN
jgi:hypothetical protein